MKIKISLNADCNLYIMSFKFHCFVKQFFQSVPKTALGLWFDFNSHLNTHEVRILYEYKNHRMYILIVFKFPRPIFNIPINVGYSPSIMDVAYLFVVQTWCNLTLDGSH